MSDYFKSAFEKAYHNLCSIAPEGLLNALNNTKDPMAFIQGDRADFPELFQESQTALGHIDLCRVHLVQGTDVPPELDMQLVGTIGWLLTQIEIFNRHQEHSRTTLAVIFEVCARLSQISAFWVYIPHEKISPDFCKVMHDVLVRIEHSTNAVAAPVWERELMSSIAEADSNQRWSVLAEHWQKFEHVVHPHFLFSEASRFLYAQDLSGLVQIVEGMASMFDILFAIERLTAEEKLHLASLSQNARARFMLVQDALFHLPKDEILNEQEYEYLESTLTKVNSCSQEWMEWMGAFNKYPSRVPQLQAALGRVLSNGSHDSLCSYINAISLYHDHNACRPQVTDCLTIFRKNASLEKRQELWKIAFDRWEQWNFGIPTGDIALMQVAWSQIDFAVIGYFVEVLAGTDLEGRRYEFSKVFIDMQFEWWGNAVEFIHKFHLEISRFALLPDPSVRGPVWSLPTTYRIPFDPKHDRYACLTFSL
jgi:hypothetical protein